MRSRKIFICLLLCAALFALPQLAFADNAPTVTITFDKDTVAVGETVTATYEINCPKGFDYGWLYWMAGSSEDDMQCPDGADVYLDQASGSVSFTPKFGEQLKIQISYHDLNGEPFDFFGEYISITGDQSKEPVVEIAMDKETVAVGETITASYEVTGEGNYTEIEYDWLISTNDGEGHEPLDSRGKTKALTGNLSYSPMFGDEICLWLCVKDENGRRYEHWGKHISVTGDLSVEPVVTIALDKESVAIGEELMAAYQIMGDEEYQNMEYGFFHMTEHVAGEIAPYGAYGDIKDNQGSIAYIPRFGKEISFHLNIQNKLGRSYHFESEYIPISGFVDGYDVYDIIEGQNTQITDGSAPLTFRANGDYGKYLGVQVNGSWVPERYVTVWEGSTCVKLSEDYLGTLDDGEHELIVVFNDGIARTQFYVGAAADMPRTGDSSTLPLWIALLALACAGSLRRRKMV